MDYELEEAVRAIGEAVGGSRRPAPVAARWRWGTVAAANGDGTMDVTVGEATLPSVRALASALGAKVGDRVRVDYLGTDAVVTGVRAANNRPLYFRDLGTNPTTTATDTRGTWAAMGSGAAWISGTGHLAGQPEEYGFLASLTDGHDVAQLFKAQRDGDLWLRGGNESMGFGDWYDVGGPRYADGTIERNTTNCSTLGTSWASKKGYVVSLSFIDAKIANALASNGNVVIATLPSGYRPRANRYLQCIEKAGLWARITAGGEVRISNRTGASIAAGQTATFSDSYWT